MKPPISMENFTPCLVPSLENSIKVNVFNRFLMHIVASNYVALMSPSEPGGTVILSRPETPTVAKEWFQEGWNYNISLKGWKLGWILKGI